MYIGHFGVAFAAKRAAPKTSLATLFFAAQFVDLLWPILVLIGLEEVQVFPGMTAVTPLDFVFYPYTHSLLAAFIWSAAGGLIYFTATHARRAAWIVGALVFSHWALDFLTHRPDLPLVFGGGLMKVGLGLWDYPAAGLSLEFSIFAAGLWFYLGATKPVNGAGRYALWALVAFLLVTWIGAVFGPPPPDGTVVAYSALLMWLLIPWAWWIDRRRSAVV